MKYFIVVILILVLFLTFSCSESRKYKVYKEFKSEVSLEVFSLFPKKTEEDLNSSYTQIIKYPFGFSSLKFCGSFIIYKYDETSYNSTINDLERRKKTKLNFDDSCNIFIPFSENFESKCETNNIPVPNLFDESIGLDSLISKNNSTYYIFDNKWGEFLNDKNYYPKFTPMIKRGFSNGAFSDPNNRIVVYWIIIW